LPIKPELPQRPKKTKPENAGKKKRTTREQPKFEIAENLNASKSEPVYKIKTSKEVFCRKPNVL